MFDLSNLLRNNQLQHEVGLSITPNNRRVCAVDMRYYSMHMAITDWFDNSGSVFDINAYVPFEEAYNKWKNFHSAFLSEHLMHAEYAECTCGPEPAKPMYDLNAERKPRLLSEVLASVVKVDQIDSIPVQRLEYLKGPGSRPPTDAEIRERRNELVEIIREEEENMHLEEEDASNTAEENTAGEETWSQDCW